jgi:hypothetical protein
MVHTRCGQRRLAANAVYGFNHPVVPYIYVQIPSIRLKGHPVSLYASK